LCFFLFPESRMFPRSGKREEGREGGREEREKGGGFSPPLFLFHPSFRPSVRPSVHPSVRPSFYPRVLFCGLCFSPTLSYFGPTTRRSETNDEAAIHRMVGNRVDRLNTCIGPRSPFFQASELSLPSLFPSLLSSMQPPPPLLSLPFPPPCREKGRGIVWRERER
jgi:hypothetical protein